LSSLTSDDINFDTISKSYTTWANFKSSPFELWIILISKFFESWCFVTEDFTFMIFFTSEFGLSDYECGIFYSLIAALTFLYGLFISGYVIDNAGVKPALLLGCFFLTLTRLLVSLMHDKQTLYLIGYTIMPLGLSLCKP